MFEDDQTVCIKVPAFYGTVPVGTKGFIRSIDPANTDTANPDNLYLVKFDDTLDDWMYEKDLEAC